MGRLKSVLLLIGAALLAGGAAVFAFFHLFIPAQRRKGAQALLKSATEKADALRIAAELVRESSKQQVTHIEQRVEQEKKQDSVDFANDFINQRKP